MEARHYLNTIDLLAALGVRLELDFDGTLQWEMPDAPDLQRLSAYILDHSKALAGEIRGRSRFDQMVFSGGPLNGQRHMLGCLHVHARNLSKARWAAYCCPDYCASGRFFYCGEATSEKKARALAWQVMTTKYRAMCPDYMFRTTEPQ